MRDSSDSLSIALAAVDARCVISRGFRATGAWALAFPEPRALKVSAVAAGHCWIRIAGETRELLAGDLVVLDGRFTYTLSSTPETPARDASELFRTSDEAIVPVGDGAGGEALVIGGHVDLGDSGEEFLLPDIGHFNVVGGGAPGAERIAWLLNALLEEMSGATEGARFALQHLTQLLLLDVLRAIAAGSAVARSSGWLRGLTDPDLAPAMRLMHSQPGFPWNLDELARAVAMSRTSFAERFRTVTGRTPIGYLQRWRLHLAQDALRSTSESVDEIAQRLGYASSSSFTNCFKRATGMAPSHYRKRAR